MIAFRHQIRKMVDRPFFGYFLAIFFMMFLTEGQTVFIFLRNRKRYQDIRRALKNDKTTVPKCERAYVESVN